MSQKTHWWLWSGSLFVAFLFVSLWDIPHNAVAGSSQEMSTLGQVHALAFHPDTYSLFLGTEHGLFVSPDEGKTWQKVSIQGPTEGIDCRTLAIDPTNPQIMYAGGHNLWVVKSTDGGASWHTVKQGLPKAEVQALTVDPRKPQQLYAWVADAGLYRSRDGGQRWQRINDGPPNPNVHTLASVNISTGMGGIYLYAGTSAGLFFDAD